MRILQIKGKRVLRYDCFERLAVLFVAFYIALNPLCSYAFLDTDPALAFAIAAQVGTEASLHSKRSKDRKAIFGTQVIITDMLDKVHHIESQVLNYMGNASSLLSNCMQMVNIVEYVAKIPGLADDVLSEAKKSPKGALLLPICSSRLNKIKGEVFELGNFVTQMVAAKYSLKNVKSEDDKKHVNLLSSAERYYILNTVETKLDEICRDLRFTKYYIRNLGWRDLWKTIDAKSYYQALAIRSNVDQLVYQWNRLGKSF